VCNYSGLLSSSCIYCLTSVRWFGRMHLLCWATGTSSLVAMLCWMVVVSTRTSSLGITVHLYKKWRFPLPLASQLDFQKNLSKWFQQGDLDLSEELEVVQPTANPMEVTGFLLQGGMIHRTNLFYQVNIYSLQQSQFFVCVQHFMWLEQLLEKTRKLLQFTNLRFHVSNICKTARNRQIVRKLCERSLPFNQIKKCYNYIISKLNF